jgi:hypothetical protein
VRPAIFVRPASLVRLLLFACLALGLGGCETFDKARMKLVGVKVCNPDQGSAEWVLNEAVQSAKDSDEERGWARLQKVLHSSERSVNALKGWHEGNWPRMRRQVKHYLDDKGCFTLRDFRTQQGDAGIDFFMENDERDLPTPCAVYIDADNNKQWRIKRCSM